VPDCAILVGRLAREKELSRARRLTLLGLAAYLAMPFDLVPDFIPVIGLLDDALLLALVLRGVIAAAGPEIVRRHWSGPDSSLRVVLRLGSRGPWDPAEH
jgi:uncharacterized membrane protein YkvA (DUF1232 family)